MRLTCPNCDAQYEIPDDVIPESGRDVQCSACGTTWFQDHPNAETDISAPTVAFEEDHVEDHAPKSESPDQTPPNLSELYEEDLEAEPEPTQPRRELDPAISDILKQEAERENAARAAEAEALEMQSDLGLDNADPMPGRQEQMLDGLEPDSPEPEETHAVPPQHTAAVESALAAMVRNDTDANRGTAAASRRELLPDIEEINSTLRSTSDRHIAGDDLDPEAPGRIRKQRGFRRGFLLILLLFAIAALAYVYAPQIVQAVPDAEPHITAYVNWVNDLRLWLDEQVQKAFKWLDAVTASSSG